MSLYVYVTWTPANARETATKFDPLIYMDKDLTTISDMAGKNRIVIYEENVFV